MKHLKTCLLVIILIQFIGSGLMRSDTIVDTGSTGPVTGQSGALYQRQWLAAEFTLTRSVTISQVSGWIYSGYEGPYPGSGGELAFVLYDSTNGTPGSVINATSINVPTNAPLGWIGPTGLNWTLAPGQYWLAFEVQTSTSFFGYMPGSSSSSLPTAYISDPYLPTSSWNAPVVSNENLGVQIYGTILPTSPIPLNIQSISNAVVLSWNDPAFAFTLQAAAAVTGVFTNVPGAVSPYTNTITGTQQYFRLVAPAN